MLGIAKKRWRWPGVLGAAAVLAVAGPEAVVAESVPAAPAVVERGEGLGVDSRTTYAIDPPAGLVHVAYDVTVTNRQPDQVTGSYIRQFFLAELSVPVLSGAVNLVAAKAGGASLPVRLEGTESPHVSLAVIDLQPNLFYPSSQSVRLTYDLPRRGPRSGGFMRFNDAYATFPTLAIGDPGTTAVEVLVPEQFEVELVGGSMEESERDGLQVFSAEAISDPDAWAVVVSARDDSKLVTRTVEVSGEDVDVLGWPDDPEWADFTATQVEKGVPVLEELTGLEWPATSTLEVVETSSPYLYGYAGWYRPIDSVIEVGDELDQQVVLHELAHLWFNHRLFEGRWINEGFASEVAAQAAEQLGGDDLVPEPVAADDPGRLSLNDWSDPDLQAGVSDEQERYGYNASWTVLHEVAAEIGPEALAEVIRAADQGRPAYAGPGIPDLRRTFDWRELLDLLAEVGGSTKAADLFERHVVSDADAEAFASRAAARERYAALVEAGDGWIPPASLRLAMTDWRFSTADELFDGAHTVLDTKAEILTVVADLDVDERLALQAAYEEGKSLPALDEEADAALAAARSLRTAEDAREEGAGPLGAVGLLLSGVDDDLSDAQRAFEEGDYDEVERRAAAVTSTMDGATAAGGMRVAALVAVALVLAVGLRLRRARRAAREPEPEPAAGGEDSVAV